jgi:hypothetical protein
MGESIMTVTTLTHQEWLDLLENMGIYPEQGYTTDGRYEKRTEFMNGWNEALLSLTQEVVAKLKKNTE